MNFNPQGIPAGLFFVKDRENPCPGDLYVRPPHRHQTDGGAPPRQLRFFIADVHALNQGIDGATLRSATLDVAAAWMACGLDPATTLFFRQSDVPEILELAALLTPLSPKSLMNRAHAYKAAVADNRASGKDPDEGVNMGLFTYPILMAADNRRWGRETLKLPHPLVSKDSALIPGTDGRKMSKSYGNVLPLFGDSRTLTALVRKVPTDSLPIEAPKDPASNPLATWYRCADPLAASGFEERLRAGGLGWGEAKAEVTEALSRLLAPIATAYRGLRGDEVMLQAVLGDGAQRARILAQGVLSRVRSRAF